MAIHPSVPARFRAVRLESEGYPKQQAVSCIQSKRWDEQQGTTMRRIWGAMGCWGVLASIGGSRAQQDACCAVGAASSGETGRKQKKIDHNVKLGTLMASCWDVICFHNLITITEEGNGFVEQS
jgi:hypothetical protein